MNQRTSLFGMQIDALRMPEAVDQIGRWFKEPLARCRYIVTPNVDHVVMYQENPALREAYQRASLVLADGLPVVLAAKCLRRGVPERVAGSDLAPALFSASKPLGGFSVFLLGAAPGVAERAAANITRRWPEVRVVKTYSPPLGFEKNEAECERILSMIATARPDLLIVGFGAPKQELWIAKHADAIQAKVALCAGATIDFLAGEKRRAPKWMRRMGLEWFHRLASEPKRLLHRYAKDAWVFPQLFWKELRRRPSTGY